MATDGGGDRIPSGPVLAAIGTMLAALMAAGLAEIIHQSAIIGQLGTDKAVFGEQIASIQAQIDRRLADERREDDHTVARVEDDHKLIMSDGVALAELRARIDLGRSERIESDAQISARLNALAQRFEEITSRIMKDGSHLPLSLPPPQ